MKLNNVWGYGQLFAFSALDGKTRYYQDFCGHLTHEKIGIRFELQEWIEVHFPIEGEIEFRAILGDLIDAKTKDGDVVITFVDASTIVGYAPIAPVVKGEKTLNYKCTLGVDTYATVCDTLGIALREEQGRVKFAITLAPTWGEARSASNYHLEADVDSLKEQRYAYYEDLPVCKNEKYEQLYYKALSVQKVNVMSPIGNISYRWTTPDRYPHRHMWLWDSVFHALALVTYNPQLAQEALLSVLTQARADGFIPHTMMPFNASDLTQAPILAWGVWEVYKKTGDIAFLRECVDSLDNYLTWDMKNRDQNGNGLLEWFTEMDYKGCQCAESGMDNSPRFDKEKIIDAIDFSTFFAFDALNLSYIYKEFDCMALANKWYKVYENIKNKINEYMWDEEIGTYSDCLLSGERTQVITPCSFLPLFAGIPSQEQAEKMVKTLVDPKHLWTKFPLATMSKSEPTFSTDYWRGSTWLNFNFLIANGLKKYGYENVAQELIDKTLENVNHWYQKTGTIFEHYDADGLVSPFDCVRGGKLPLAKPDRRIQAHSITDFNWSACFTMLFIQNELYI